MFTKVQQRFNRYKEVVIEANVIFFFVYLHEIPKKEEKKTGKSDKIQKKCMNNC